jgi:hypothetical protein
MARQRIAETQKAFVFWPGLSRRQLRSSIGLLEDHRRNPVRRATGKKLALPFGRVDDIRLHKRR